MRHSLRTSISPRLIAILTAALVWLCIARGVALACGPYGGEPLTALLARMQAVAPAAGAQLIHRDDRFDELDESAFSALRRTFYVADGARLVAVTGGAATTIVRAVDLHPEAYGIDAVAVGGLRAVVSVAFRDRPSRLFSVSLIGGRWRALDESFSSDVVIHRGSPGAADIAAPAVRTAG